ncbi:hypothetical protein [uncultured Duncaniella sp.]|uniref:hypothetical protein n=1 Tax=uncultured Duncaniella sp. TaxID=2768039 RepID=UPI0025AA235C|nr:hypothetical protein [uncultured Duncaniella sp.]
MLLGNAGAKGRHIVGVLNAAERRNLVRCVVFRQERIGMCRSGSGGSADGNGCQGGKGS